MVETVGLEACYVLQICFSPGSALSSTLSKNSLGKHLLSRPFDPPLRRRWTRVCSGRALVALCTLRRCHTDKVHEELSLSWLTQAFPEALNSAKDKLFGKELKADVSRTQILLSLNHDPALPHRLWFWDKRRMPLANGAAARTRTVDTSLMLFFLNCEACVCVSFADQGYLH